MQLTDIEKQIADLLKQKEQLLKKQHDDALAAAQKAVDAVNALGYKYRITGGAGASTAKRRTGVRDEVLKAVKDAQTPITPAGIAEGLGMDDKAGKQSVANALSALKKAGKVVAEDGVYRVQ